MPEASANKKIRISIKLIIWLFPLFLGVWILDKNFVPRGTLEIKYDVTEESSQVRNFASKEKDKLIGTNNKSIGEDYFQLITTSPLYFDVEVPRSFRKVTVSVMYQNPDSQPVIKLGVKQSNKAFYYKNLAFQQPELENISVYWNSIRDGSIVLWQKNVEHYQKTLAVVQWRDGELALINTKYAINESYDLSQMDSDESGLISAERKAVQEEYQQRISEITLKNPDPVYSSVSEFLRDNLDFDRVLKYNYDLAQHFPLPGYSPNNKITTIDKSIRGSHNIYTYIGGGEQMNFTFTIQDINRHDGEDIFSVQVYNKNDELVKVFSVDDDGESEASGKVLPERILTISLDDLPLGVYRLDISVADDDIFIKKIETLQKYIAFRRKVFVTDNDEYQSILGDKELRPTVLYTNSDFVSVETPHEKGFQKLTVGSQELLLTETHSKKRARGLTGITTIISPKNDVRIEGNKFFAFSKNQLFDPFYSIVPELQTVGSIDDFDFIIADYPVARSEGGWLIAETSVEVPNLYFGSGEDKVVNFILSLPGLPENNRVLKVKEINFIFEKEPITIANFFTRLSRYIKDNI